MFLKLQLYVTDFLEIQLKTTKKNTKSHRTNLGLKNF